MARTLALAAIAVLVLLASPAAASTELSILVPGNFGGLPTAVHSLDQAPLYDGLTPLRGNVTAQDLTRFFKPAVLGTRGQGPYTREQTPNRSVTIQRDRFGVPHISAARRADVLYGAGWVMYQDRRVLLDQGRGIARLAIIDAPNLDAFRTLVSGRTFTPSAEADAYISEQIGMLRRAGRRGRLLLSDMDAYLRGLNAARAVLHAPGPPWTRVDMIAVSGFIGSIFGRGGGDEARRAAFLDAAQRQLGPGPGRAVFNDMRAFKDNESPVSIDRPFPYGTIPASATGSVTIDDGSYRPVPASTAARATAAAAPEPARASNALLVSAKRSASGHPIFVAGPQLGVFYPSLVMEMELRGGGLDARGAAIAGAGPYVFIGRGTDYAWSLTSENGDIVDLYAETLCGDSEFKYLYKGTCRDMGTFNAGVLGASGDQPEGRVAFRTTVHGPVVGYATSGGRRTALSRKRSTRGRESLSLLPLQRLNARRGIRSGGGFVQLMSGFEHTFNAFYADRRDIAMIATGRLPIRPTAVDPGLPADGRGDFEWRGWLSASRHPHVVNPASGVILNWNNRPAPGFAAADSDWSWGAIQRKQLFEGAIGARKKHTPASVVAAMNRAATQDLRAVAGIPAALAVLKSGPASSPRAAQMISLLERWRADGAPRIDTDGDGKVDAAGAAIIEAWWPRLGDAVLGRVLGPLLPRLAEIHARSDAPTGARDGSYFGSGWESYIDKDLRALAGETVRTPLRRRYCGGGDVAACRSDLYVSLEAAGDALAAAQGPDPAGWRADATVERVEFLPRLVSNTIRFVNRPTFQQVMSFGD